MSEQLQSPSKRALFKTAAAMGATLAASSLVACQQQTANSAGSASTPATSRGPPATTTPPFCHKKSPPRESIICGWVVGRWITKALIMLKFLLKSGQK